MCAMYSFSGTRTNPKDCGEVEVYTSIVYFDSVLCFGLFRRRRRRRLLRNQQLNSAAWRTIPAFLCTNDND